MKFKVSGDWNGEITALSYNDAQAIIEERIHVDNAVKAFIRRWLGVKKSYDFSLEMVKE